MRLMALSLGERGVKTQSFEDRFNQLKAHTEFAGLLKRVSSIFGSEYRSMGILSIERSTKQVVQIEGTESPLIDMAIEPFKTIEEVSEIRAEVLNDVTEVHVFAHMPRYSRDLMFRLIEAEHKSIAQAERFGRKLRYQFYPVPTPSPSDSVSQKAHICFKRT